MAVVGASREGVVPLSGQPLPNAAKLAPGTLTDTAVGIEQIRTIAAGGDEAIGDQLLVPTSGNQVEILDGLRPFMARLVRDVDATPNGSWITFETYSLKSPSTSTSEMSAVLAALRRASARGVRVTGLVDVFGSGLLGLGSTSGKRKAFIQSLREQGIDVRVSPMHLTPSSDTPMFGLSHRKAWVLRGGTVAYSGGINAVDQWASWHDEMVRTEGPAAAQIGARLLGRAHDLGVAAEPRMVDDLVNAYRTPLTTSRYGVRFLTNGGRSRREISNAYLSMLDTARGAGQDEILMSAPYMSDPGLLSAAVAAARRGVKLTLFIAPPPKEEKEHAFIAPFRLMWAHDIIAAGGQVVMADSFSHFKGMVRRPLDGSDAHRAVANIGSCNFDARSIRINRENNLLSDDPAFVRGAVRVFDEFRNGRERVLRSEDVSSWGWRAFIARELGLRF